MNFQLSPEIAELQQRTRRFIAEQVIPIETREDHSGHGPTPGAASPATVSRWTADKAFPQPKTQLLISDLRYVVDRLAEYYSPEETRIWLYSKHPLLNGERAIDLIHQARTGEVLRVIEGLDESTYT